MLIGETIARIEGGYGSKSISKGKFRVGYFCIKMMVM